MRRSLVGYATLMMVLVSLGGAWAQMGTVNLISPRVWTDKHPEWQVEARVFGGTGNGTWGGGVRLAMPKSQELMVLYNALDVTGGDKIAGNLQDSNWDAFSVDWKWQRESRQEHCTWAVIPELNFGSRGPEGRITGTTNTARGPEVIPAVAVAAERQYGRLTMLLEPKLAWFGDNWDNSEGGSTPAFGTVLTLGAGARYPGLGGYFAGDLSAVLAGDNAISQNTGLLKPTPLWSLSWTEVLLMHGDPTITVFAANTVGPSIAESMIGTPGAEFATGTGGGARITGHF